MKLKHDKARYQPDEIVTFTLEQMTVALIGSKLEVTIYHLQQEVATFTVTITEQNGESGTFTWQVPPQDFCGYLAKTVVKTPAGNREELYTAIDVSSDWRKFPRYGYLTDFAKDKDTGKIIDEMANWQLNAIEYYDWKFLHHQPIPKDGSMAWEDWAGRKISGNTIKSYIAEAKKRNMINMSYNMIYAATNNYAEYGVKEEWGLWYAGGEANKGRQAGERFVFKMGDSPSGQNSLYFFDIENPEWQDFIIEKNIAALDEMGFDGWHGDTVGEWGPMWTQATFDDPNKSKRVKDGYQSFLNLAKKRLGADRFLSFNPVGAQGIEQVNTSEVDMLYAEIWPWDEDRDGEYFDSYGSLKKVVDCSREESGGKSLVIPAYMEYTYACSVAHEPFNMAAVLLTDAAVYAAGGSRIELGDGHEMLSSEYFPNKNLYMDEIHRAKQLDLQNFIVAYENLLRDGLEDNGRAIQIKDEPVSAMGTPATIWSYSKENAKYETIQLINLLGVKQSDWRAAEGIKETPQPKQNLILKYYTDSVYQEGWFVSPDQLRAPLALPVAVKADDQGSYLELQVPSLDYWSMLFFVK